ncbi:hypothetical protein F5882DRAFT_302036, partial [Hyaloscypha sp. PMI_1271]
PEDIPRLTSVHESLMATSCQRVELTPWLLVFANSDMCPKGPISMLNLVSFRPLAFVQESYLSYIETMKEEIGAKHGLVLKLSGGGVALVWYSSFQHFTDTLSDGDY